VITLKAIQQVIVLLTLDEKNKRRLKNLLPNATILYKTTVTKEEIEHTQIILGNPPIDLLQEPLNLQLLCLQTAGSDQYCKSGIIAPTTLLTNASGCYGTMISEYMMASLLMLYRKLDRYYEHKKLAIWKEEESVKTIYGSKVVIVGLGDIGSEFAKKIKAFGAYTIGIRRTLREKPTFIDEIATLAQLNDYLIEADIVALSLPQSEETIHLFNKDRLLKMKKDAVLLNVGRGSAVVLDDLVSVMQQGHLFGSVLDVTEIEPLPKNHPAWQVENLFITPHISGSGNDSSRNNVFNLIIDNLEAYLTNKKMKNIVDFRTGYRKL